MNDILPAGTTLKNNSYRIQRLLGQGSFGAVYLADDLIMNQPCAIKESFDNSPGAQAQFEVEARILANLSHSHLPRVTDNFIEPANGLQYLVMEYVEGQDLGELLEQHGPLPEDKVLAWMDQVLDAVAYLHRYKPRPVIHRDIKPDNIRLLPDGQTVKLVDFGIAKIGGVSDQTWKAARGYTPGFSPPEQYGTGTDTYSDVYALGATLYNLLTNVIPPESIDIAHSGAKLVPPRHLNPQISLSVEQVVLTAMQLDPQLRFPTAGEIRLALQGKRPTTISAACPHCGEEVRAGARFCNQCGQPIVRVAPFVFKQSGYQAKSVKDLVSGCDRYWDEGKAYFWRGEFEPWLASLGKQGQALANRAKTIRAKHTDQSAALEEFLEAANRTRSLPILTLDQTALDFGSLRKGDSKVLSFAISNSGRGYLHGTLDAKPPNWLSVHPTSFGCLSGAQQKIDVAVKTANLSGTELGVDYSGTVSILSNRGQQTVAVRLKVVDEPQAVLDVSQINLGRVAYGARVRRQFTVTNRGGGTLQGTVRSLDNWMMVDPTSQPFALSKQHQTVVYFTVDSVQLSRRGGHTGRLQVQSNGGNPVVSVSVMVDVPFPLDPTDPASQVSTTEELRDFCDREWQAGMNLLSSGRIGTFLRFIGEPEAARMADQCRQMPDKAIGLERLLRGGLGAKPPTKYDTNAMDVVSALGLGPLPKLFGRPEVVTLRILNKSKRGYLHGQVEPLVEWLHIPQPRFGCLPGQVAEVKIHVDKKRRKIGLFSLGTELFEIVLE